VCFLALLNANPAGRSVLTSYLAGQCSPNLLLTTETTAANIYTFIFICFVQISFGNAVGAMYVREYFEESARQSANDMVKDIQNVFTEIIDELDWMDDQTRLRAKEKANAMATHIAYPDELLDDKKLSDRYENVKTIPRQIFSTNVEKTK
jgi:predicted metalloendopeptidase